MRNTKSLGEIVAFKSGGTPRKANPRFWGGGYPWVSAKDLKVPVLMNSIDTLTEEGFSNANIAPKDSLLILVRGMTLHKNVPVGLAGRDVAFNQDLKALLPFNGVESKYLLYYLLAKESSLLRLVDSAGHGTGRLNTDLLKAFPVLLPPLPEQKAIAAALSTWDLAISNTERLIQAKEKRFAWLLNTLINQGSKKGEWKKVKLGDVGEISSAGVDKKTNENEISVRLVNYLDVYRRDLIFSHELTHQVTAPAAKAKKCSVEKGDVFFTPSSEVRDDIGHSAVAMEDIPDAVYSYHIVRLRLYKNWNMLYRAYAFKGSDFYRQAQRLCDGSGQRYVLSQDDFRQIQVMVPPLPEQKRIAETLNLAQREIDLLKKLAEKQKLQKRGLMQKLLTGTWRVEMEAQA